MEKRWCTAGIVSAIDERLRSSGVEDFDVSVWRQCREGKLYQVALDLGDKDGAYMGGGSIYVDSFESLERKMDRFVADMNNRIPT